MKYYKLKDLCTAIVDCPHSTPEWKSEGIRIVRNFNLVDGNLDFSDGYFVDENTYKERIRRAIPEEGDIIVSREAPMGVVAIVPKGLKCCLGQRLVLLKVDRTKCEPYYLLSVLMSKFVQTQFRRANATGSIVSNLCIPDLENLVIPVIDKEQCNIANLVEKINLKLQLNKKAHDALQQTAKTIYDYWFLQFNFPDKTGRPYKLNGGSMIWNDKLKCDIPVGWEVTTLKGLFSVERGISYASKDIDNNNGNPMINLASIDTNRNYKPNELKYYNGKIPEKAMLKAYDLLIACTDLTRNADIVGCPILVPTDSHNYTFSMDMAKITSTNDKLDEMYLYMTLRTDFYHRFIKRWASGTNVLHLDLDGLEWYTTWLPPIDLQMRYGKIMRRIHMQSCILMEENNKLTMLRDWLLPMLMNGQVTINN